MIQIFITGGTFDKSYNYKNGELFFEKTHLPEMLKRSRCRLKISVETLMMIDSLEMNSSHINNIISKCQECLSNKIVITHGTDRMVSTAKALTKAKINNKTIMNSSSGKTSFYFSPKNWRYFKSNQPIYYSSSLLSIHQIIINFPRIFNCF